MTKKLLAILFSALMIVTCMAGCSTTEEVWVSVEDEDGDNGDNTEKTTRAKRTTKGQGQSGDNTEKTDKNAPVKTRQPGGTGKGGIDFKPVADAGANYKVKGEVSIAVDTVRPTDYDAMFDVMQKLYPNIKFTFDMWSHSSNDDGREYLSSRAKTGTMANIMWDEAGEMPVYLRQGWVYPITKLVAADPEAKNIPANLKKDYTFGGELYAVPHQATFETVTFNMDLLAQTGKKLPPLEWSMKDYESYLKAGADLFNKGKCVAVQDLFETYNRVCFYETSKKSGTYGVRGYNWATNQMEVDPLITGAKQFRAWRVMQVGVEGWQEGQTKNSEGQTNIQQKLGLANYGQAWKSGKALMEDDINVYVDKYYNQVKFNFKMWTSPNYKGKMMMHVDHCFITASTPKDRIDACYQALRFMTFSTNGNLARLEMYETKNKGKYNLNSVVYFPTTTSTAVIDKFSKLDCTTEVHDYYIKNIKNCGRYDTFKLVPELRDLTGEHLSQKLNNITDGLDESGEGLREPSVKFNADMKTAWANFEKELAEVQKKFNDTHK